EYFDGPGFWFETWPRSVEIKTLALDPSKGKDAKQGDYAAFVKLAMDKSMVLYCEADLQRRPTPQIVAAGVEMVREFQPNGFAIESNQFQELLCADGEQESGGVLGHGGGEEAVEAPACILEIAHDLARVVYPGGIGPDRARHVERGVAALIQQEDSKRRVPHDLARVVDPGANDTRDCARHRGGARRAVRECHAR